MATRNLWISGWATAIVTALLYAGSPSVSAGNNNHNNDRPAAVPAVIKIDNFSFEPQTLTVPSGTTVTWTNQDDIPHTAASTDGIFKSKVMDTDEKFSYTFTKAGTYPYYCTIHPKMTGKVVVQ